LDINNNDQNIEERDKLVFDIIFNRYEIENQRTKGLDGKSISIIGIIGILISLQAGITFFSLKEMPNIFTVFLSTIFILFYSILFAIKAYYSQKWKFVPEPKYFIEEYAKKNRNKIDILRLITTELCYAIRNNTEQNNLKVNDIIYSFLFLVSAIVFIGIENIFSFFIIIWSCK
jgi:hypothetical protein